MTATLTKVYPDTALGAKTALRAMVHGHMAVSTKRGPDPYSWEIEVLWLPGDLSDRVLVYLAPHPLGGGPSGADFETID